QLLQRVVAFHLAQELGELLAHLQHLVEDRHLLGDAGRVEVGHAAEVQLDVELLVAVAGELVLDGVGDARLLLGHDAVEVVGADLNETTGYKQSSIAPWNKKRGPPALTGSPLADVRAAVTFSAPPQPADRR